MAPPPEPWPVALLSTFQFWSPIVVLALFILIAAARSILTARDADELDVPAVKGPGGNPLPITKKKPPRSRPSGPTFASPQFGLLATRVFQYLSAMVLLTFVGSGTIASVRAFSSRQQWWAEDAVTVYVLGSASAWLYVFITLFEWRQAPNVAHCVAWVLGSLFEAVILASSFAIHDHPATARRLSSSYTTEAMLVAVRLVLLSGLATLYLALSARPRPAGSDKKPEVSFLSSPAHEASPLLGGRQSGYRSTDAPPRPRGRSTSASDPSGRGQPAAESAGMRQHIDQDAAFYRPEKLPHKTWWEYIRGYSLFFPYLWPLRSPRLQLIVIVCFVLLVLQRAVNILVPYQLGVVTDVLAGGDHRGDAASALPWKELLVFIAYKLLQGPSGVLGSTRSLLWIPVSQYSYRALVEAAFQHVHSLSLDFHTGKRTGEVLSALNKGSAINNFLEQVTFQVFPMLVDLLVAIGYFYVSFGVKYAVLVSILTFYYLYITVNMAATRADQRRDMTNADREEVAIKNDSIVSYETVKYFNAEVHEFERYRGAIRRFQDAEAKVFLGLNIMNVCQSMIFMVGLLAVMMLSAYEVGMGVRKVGEFVTVMTYLAQLQGPLNFFGSFYRTIQQAMISGERLLELFKVQPTVVDRPGVRPLKRFDGHVRWKNVDFRYDPRRPALRDISFECIPGTTTAFVGESGGGKSTLFRLMYRFYDCNGGTVEFDGVNVKDLTVDSVRRHIGVVPQDAVLFNDTLMYNLRYANKDATDDQIYDACKAASIHDRILSFSDGYDTKVGERGMRLSGGEKQRVAIARTILKNPRIIMLDEATSALDSSTEQKIQEKLSTLGEGRTVLVIAHRLSTIKEADQIVVLHGGYIVEKGNHKELMQLNGRYYEMWQKQARAEKAEAAAAAAQRRANKLLRQANINTSDHHHQSNGSDHRRRGSTAAHDRGGRHGCDTSSSSESGSSKTLGSAARQNGPATLDWDRSPNRSDVDHSEGAAGNDKRAGPDAATDQNSSPRRSNVHTPMSVSPSGDETRSSMNPCDTSSSTRDR